MFYTFAIMLILYHS